MSHMAPIAPGSLCLSTTSQTTSSATDLLTKGNVTVYAQLTVSKCSHRTVENDIITSRMPKTDSRQLCVLGIVRVVCHATSEMFRARSAPNCVPTPALARLNGRNDAISGTAELRPFNR